MRVLTDFHHNSLMISHVKLFEERLKMDVYRPIGMEWFNEGFWQINQLEDTAKQFLAEESNPVDNTPPLNDVANYKPLLEGGIMQVFDPGHKTKHWACTLDFFKRTKFDYVIASIPAHVEPFKRLIEQYNPTAKLIVQAGNNWQLDSFSPLPLLASIKPQPYNGPAVFYHQEFDTKLFCPTKMKNFNQAYSFVNVLQDVPENWATYNEIKSIMESRGWDVRAYGGQNPDGNMQGAEELAAKMKEMTYLIHIKYGGDGYGHIIHNAYAIGRPLIAKSSQYAGQLASDLMVPGTFIDIDAFPSVQAAIDHALSLSNEEIAAMGKRASDQFKKVVNFGKEAKEIEQWLKDILAT